MFDFFATLFCGGAAAFNWMSKEGKADKYRKEAIERGDVIYWDGNGSTFRSTETNEIVIHRNVNGRDEDIGISTHRVYKYTDKNQNKERQVYNLRTEDNRKLEECNQKFYWKRMNSWETMNAEKHNPVYAQFDKVNDKPIWNISKNLKDGKYHIYYAHPRLRMKNYYIDDSGRTHDDERIITDEEYNMHYSKIINENNKTWR